MRSSKLVLGGVGLIGLGAIVLGMGKVEQIRRGPKGNPIMPNRGPLVKVPEAHTRVSHNELKEIVKQALETIVPDSPEGMANAVNMFLTHSAREVGQNAEQMYNNNPGFITTNSGEYFLHPESDTRHKYISFESPLDGFTYMISLIMNYYPDAWDAAWTGDPVAYAHGLKTGVGGREYYEASEDVYRQVFVPIYEKFAAEDLTV